MRRNHLKNIQKIKITDFEPEEESAPPRLQLPAPFFRGGVYGFEFVTCKPLLLKYIIPLVPALSSDDMIYLLIVTNN